MVESIARVRFWWNVELSKCRATAYGANDEVLGEVTIELPVESRRRIWSHGGVAQFRIEDLAERHLRTMLELRY